MRLFSVALKNYTSSTNLQRTRHALTKKLESSLVLGTVRIDAYFILIHTITKDAWRNNYVFKHRT